MRVNPPEWVDSQRLFNLDKFMALLKSRKAEMIKDIENAFSKSKSVVFVNFHGLKVGDETRLRQGLRSSGVGYKVSRKTLLAKALSGKADGEMPNLSGEVAMAYADDVLSPAREVFNFQKENKVPLSILGGVFEGKFVGQEMMMELATIPSREVLLSKIAFLLKSPIQRLAIAVNEVAKTK